LQTAKIERELELTRTCIAAKKHQNRHHTRKFLWSNYYVCFLKREIHEYISKKKADKKEKFNPHKIIIFRVFFFIYEITNSESNMKKRGEGEIIIIKILLN
jgi:hypothetical protein